MMPVNEFANLYWTMRLLKFDERGELQLTEDLIDKIAPLRHSLAHLGRRAE
jgi:hypothetical protein